MSPKPLLLLGSNPLVEVWVQMTCVALFRLPTSSQSGDSAFSTFSYKNRFPFDFLMSTHPQTESGTVFWRTILKQHAEVYTAGYLPQCLSTIEFNTKMPHSFVRNSLIKTTCWSLHSWVHAATSLCHGIQHHDVSVPQLFEEQLKTTLSLRCWSTVALRNTTHLTAPIFLRNRLKQHAEVYTAEYML